MTPAVLKLAPYWIIEPTSLEAIALRAEVAEANPLRAGASDWRQAGSMARLAQRCVAAGHADGAAMYSLEAYRFANRAELLEGPATIVARDARRQAGTRTPRRPEIDAWIDKALKADPGAKSPELWSTAPRSITDVIAEDAFKKRVTKARKRAASK